MTVEIQKRQHFRVRYPISQRPIIEIDGCKYQVIELSKSGLRMSIYLGLLTSVPLEAVYADVALVSGHMRTISAKIQRRDGKEFVLVDLQGITSGDIIQEQQFLIRNDPLHGIE